MLLTDKHNQIGMPKQFAVAIQILNPRCDACMEDKHQCILCQSLPTMDLKLCNLQTGSIITRMGHQVRALKIDELLNIDNNL